ncbi:MAG: hypothetical protein NXH72_10980 [Hyphomonadaceae bacterium]|nr:hypothetical protein [Hyphomonadaceae bacterium]
MRGRVAVTDDVQVEHASNDRADKSVYILDKWYVAARLNEVSKHAEKAFKICGRDLILTRETRDQCTARDAATNKPVPCEISEDLIWTFIASDESRHADPGPVPGFGGPKGKVRFMEKVIIPAHQDDAVYGLLDPAHTPFVHRSPLWRGNGILKEKRKSFEPSQFGFTMMPHAPVNSDIYHLIGGAISVRIAFRLPGLRAEYIQNSKHCVLGLTALTPIDETRTVLRQIFYWDTPILGAIRPFATLFARPFLNQDVNIMALRQKNLGYRGKGMLVGDSDKQFLWYLSLKKAWNASGRCRKSFQNPLSPATLRWKT